MFRTTYRGAPPEDLITAQLPFITNIIKFYDYLSHVLLLGDIKECHMIIHVLNLTYLIVWQLFPFGI